MILSDDHISVVEASGELDSCAYEGKALLKKIQSLIRFEWGRIVLNFQDVHHIHSDFLMQLAVLKKVVETQAGELKLANLNTYTRDLLRLSGLGQNFEMYDSVAEAILSFDTSVAHSSATH